MSLISYLSEKLGVPKVEERILEELRKPENLQLWDYIADQYEEDCSFPSAFKDYLFYTADGAGIFLRAVKKNCEAENGTFETDRFNKIAEQMDKDEVRSEYLNSLSEYFKQNLSGFPPFSVYEDVLQYSLLYCRDMNTDELTDTFYNNFLYALGFAGEEKEKGYAFNGKNILIQFGRFMPQEVVQQVIFKNIKFEYKIFSYRVETKRMWWLINFSICNDSQKETYRFLSGNYSMVTNWLLNIAESRISEKWFNFHTISEADTSEKDVYQVFEDNQSTRAFMHFKKSLNPIWWEVQFLIDDKLLWKLCVKLGVKEKNKWEMAASIKDDKINSGNGKKAVWEVRDFSNLELVSELVLKLRKFTDVQFYKGAQVAGMWHEELFGGSIPERLLVFTDEISIERKQDHVKHFKFSVKNPEDSGYKKESLDFFCINRAHKGMIQNIQAIVGKNGSGKTSSFRMICEDGPLGNEGENDSSGQHAAKYIIFYKIAGEYYYSTNMSVSEVIIEGLPRNHNIVKDRSKKAVVVYFTNVLSLYQEADSYADNFIDISNPAIYKREISSGEPEKKCLDVLRQLRFLDDLYRSYRDNAEKINDIMREFSVQSVHVRISKSFRQFTSENLYPDLFNRSKINQNNNEYLDAELRFNNQSELHEVYRFCRSMVQNIKDYTDKMYCDNKVIGECSLSMQPLSSGQQAKLELFSRLHSLFTAKWEMPQKDMDSLKMNDYKGAEHANYILLLDEMEAYMHPEWQRCFVYDLIRFLEWENREEMGYQNIQVILSSNSPFFMSDLPSGNICVLYQDEKEKAEIDKMLENGTFAQNIHQIMSSAFFMKDGLMGEFAKVKIAQTMDFLECGNQNEKKNSEKEKETAEAIIKWVGEPVLKKILLDLYSEKYDSKNSVTDEEMSGFLETCTPQQRKWLMQKLQMFEGEE